MKKVFLTVFGFVFLSSFSLKVDCQETSLTNYQDLTEEEGICQLYAEYLGRKVEETGGNYYEGYFVGYAECLDKLGVGGL